jgi:hypothetical protein
MDEFLALSRLLTGLSLTAAGDSKSVESRMASDYLRLLRERFGPGFDALLVLFRSIAGNPNPLAALLQDAGFSGATEVAARQIVLLWMLSQYQVVDAAGKSTDLDGGFYEKGAVWPLIGSHPIGFSHLPYGYWSSRSSTN